jgi:hypothetical protein
VLDATTPNVAAVDRLLVVATDTGQVSTLTPSQPLARTSDELGGVDLTTHRTVWSRPGLRAGAMAGALFIGVMTGEQQDRVVAVAGRAGPRRPRVPYTPPVGPPR